MGKKIVRGFNSSIDGLIATWMAKNLLSPWKDAELVTARNDNEADQLGKEPDTLVVNVGTGEFSGHPHDKYPNDCASTLLAKKYGLNTDPRVTRLLKLALISDKRPVHDIIKMVAPQFKDDANALLLASLPPMVKSMYSCEAYKQEEVYTWVAAYFYAEWKNQVKFLDEAVPEFCRKAVFAQARVGELGRINFRPIAAIRSDNDRIQKVAQSKFGKNQHLLFQCQSTGNWAIFGFHSLRVNRIAAVIRAAEIKKMGRPMNCSLDYLESDGTLPEVPTIHYHRNGEQIFNGSLTHPNVQPTKLGFEEIWNLIQIALEVEEYKKYFDLDSEYSFLTHRIPLATLADKMPVVSSGK